MAYLGSSAVMLVGLLIESVRSRRGDPIALQLLLDGVDLQANARLARGAALTKFALLVVALGYVSVRSLQRVSPA